jgi:hypothetical protein
VEPPSVVRAQCGLDMPLKMGEGSVAEGALVRGPRDGQLGKTGKGLAISTKAMTLRVQSRDVMDTVSVSSRYATAAEGVGGVVKI